jgi:ribosomal-protein-alanine N-acetyltransferase
MASISASVQRSGGLVSQKGRARKNRSSRERIIHPVIIPVIRLGGAGDLSAIAAIQQDSPGASQWDVASYLEYSLKVAIYQDQVAGFLVSRPLGHPSDSEESEILNLAVSPDFRRLGIGRALVISLLESLRGPTFLEVRASNPAAISLYKSLGFQEVGRRPGYYETPPEAAIVMKFHSC